MDGIKSKGDSYLFKYVNQVQKSKNILIITPLWNKGLLCDVVKVNILSTLKIPLYNTPDKLYSGQNSNSVYWFSKLFIQFCSMSTLPERTDFVVKTG